MYQIKIKGEYQDIQVDNGIGREILTSWTQYKENPVKENNVVVSAGGWHGTVSEIRSIKEIADDLKQYDDNDEPLKREYDEWVNKTPKEKAEYNLTTLELFHYAIAQEDLDAKEDFKQKLLQATEKYFEEHPKRTMVNVLSLKGVYNNNGYTNLHISPIGINVFMIIALRESWDAYYAGEIDKPNAEETQQIKPVDNFLDNND